MEEKELFQEYELKNWELSPRLYKIIGVALAAHLFGVIAVSQMNLFGARACDSPYVGKVCQVLETAYIAATLLGTDTEFSSRDYAKTEIEEDLGEVTFINVDEQFNYPAGYFDLSNPVPPPTDIAAIQNGAAFPTDGSIPGIPGNLTSPQTLDPKSPAVLPPANPNAIEGEIPSSPLGAIKDFPQAKVPKNFPKPKPYKFPPVKNGKNPTLSNDSPKSLPSDDQIAKLTEKEKGGKKNAKSKETPKEKPEEKKTEPVAENSDEAKLFNKKPLEDFGNEYGNKILSKEVDINAPFEIQVVAKLDDKGKLIKPVMRAKDGSDPKMTEVAKQAISAFGDSQLLKKLYDIGGRNVKITFAQNADNLQAIIATEAESDNKAKSLYNALNLILKNIPLQEGSDEQVLLKKTELKADGKILFINFLIPNEEKAKMIEKNLRSLQEKQKKSGNAETQTTGKVVNPAK